MLQKVYKAFGLTSDPANAAAFGSGLINHTWKLTDRDNLFILQRINEQVFKEPFAIASNIKMVGDYLEKNYPEYLFVNAVPTVNGEELYFNDNDGYFRLSPFVHRSHTIDVVEKPGQAFEAARQFGLFTKLLSGINVKDLQITLP